MTLDDLHALAHRYTRDLFRTQGRLLMTFFAIDRSHNLHTLCVPQYADKREFYENVMKAYFVHHGVTAYAFAMEAWMASGEKEDVHVDAGGRMHMAPGKLTPSDNPNRREVVITTALDANEVRLHSYSIERPEGKPPRLGKLIDSHKDIIVERCGASGLLIDPAIITDEGRAFFAKAIPAVLARDYFAFVHITPRAVWQRSRN